MPILMYTLNYLFSFISLSLYTPVTWIVIDEASIALWKATVRTRSLNQSNFLSGTQGENVDVGG